MVVPIGGIPCCMAERDVLLASVMLVRERLKGDAALSESMDVAGDTPSDKFDRLRQFWRNSASASVTVSYKINQSTCFSSTYT